MLQRLYIKNYVIIDELNIHFDPQLNVLTGETGAGKSIIVGALSLILGDRADSSVLISKNEKCIVEAAFNISGKKNIQKLLAAEDLDVENETIIRREISATGKSRAFINDTPVNLTVLNAVTDLLVDLHRQFDQYLMKHGHFVFDILDAVSGNQENVKGYRNDFYQYQNVKRRHHTLANELAEIAKEADYKRFLLQELEECDFQDGEIEQTEKQLKELEHAEQIVQALQNIRFTLEESESAVNTELRRLEQQLDGLMSVYPEAQELSKRLESTRLELKDISDECETYQNKLEINPEKLQILKDRIDAGYRLLKKHRVQTTKELLAIAENLAQDLSGRENLEQELAQLEVEEASIFEKIVGQAKRLHQKRERQAPIFAKEINRLLHLIGLPNATVRIDVAVTEDYNEFGKSKIDFLWDANKSGSFQPIQKAASGGELSRIMLCLKTLTAEAIDLPTLIFDEVDTGVSGEAARQVGLLLQKLSRRHQVVCITHQPQVAGRGDSHFYVYKESEKGRIQTRIRRLNDNDRIRAIAEMIGGEHPSDAALKNAREMMQSE